MAIAAHMANVGVATEVTYAASAHGSNTSSSSKLCGNRVSITRQHVHCKLLVASQHTNAFAIKVAF